MVKKKKIHHPFSVLDPDKFCREKRELVSEVCEIDSSFSDEPGSEN